MKLIAITAADNDALAFIKALYETSFPLAERRAWGQLVSMIGNGQMEVGIVSDGYIYVGFAIWWQIEEWFYLEHFAIDPALRGQQYGSRVMEMFLEKASRKLVLEVEHANNVDSQRRIAFYKKLGLDVVQIEYYQPPYIKDGSPIAMHLMVGEKIIDLYKFQKLVGTIKEKVYEQFY